MGLRYSVHVTICSSVGTFCPNLENHMEKTKEDEMETEYVFQMHSYSVSSLTLCLGGRATGRVQMSKGFSLKRCSRTLGHR